MSAGLQASMYISVRMGGRGGGGEQLSSLVSLLSATFFPPLLVSIILSSMHSDPLS